jgi:DNA-binding CsgD family transcriptional regulator
MDLYPIVDLLGLGVAIVTKQARIIVVNHAARAIFDNSGVLSAPDGKLKAKSVAHSRALFDAIARVAQVGATAPVGFSILRTSQRPLSVLVTSLRRGEIPIGRRSQNPIAVLMSDPELQDALEPNLAAALFDLTPTESMIATLLMRAKSTASIAKELKISSHTLRNHLKRMFAKTNTKGQSDLLYVLLRSPACLRLNMSALGQVP